MIALLNLALVSSRVLPAKFTSISWARQHPYLYSFWASLWLYKLYVSNSLRLNWMDIIFSQRYSVKDGHFILNREGWWKWFFSTFADNHWNLYVNNDYFQYNKIKITSDYINNISHTWKTINSTHEEVRVSFDDMISIYYSMHV